MITLLRYPLFFLSAKILCCAISFFPRTYYCGDANQTHGVSTKKKYHRITVCSVNSPPRTQSYRHTPQNIFILLTHTISWPHRDAKCFTNNELPCTTNTICTPSRTQPLANTFLPRLRGAYGTKLDRKQLREFFECTKHIKKLSS